MAYPAPYLPHPGRSVPRTRVLVPSVNCCHLVNVFSSFRFSGSSGLLRVQEAFLFL